MVLLGLQIVNFTCMLRNVDDYVKGQWCTESGPHKARFQQCPVIIKMVDFGLPVKLFFNLGCWLCQSFRTKFSNGEFAQCASSVSSDCRNLSPFFGVLVRHDNRRFFHIVDVHTAMVVLMLSVSSGFFRDLPRRISRAVRYVCPRNL